MSFDEAVSYSFIDTGLDGVFETVAGLHNDGAEEKYITLQDSVIVGAVRMRPTLLPGLLDAVRLNFNHQRRTIRLFEIGKVFASAGGEDGLPTERKLLSMVITGSDELEGRSSTRRELDFYDAKGAVEAALSAVGIERAIYAPAGAAHLRTGQSASISIDDSVVGTFGRLNEEIGVNYKFKQPVYVVEIDIQAVLAAAPDSVFYQALPKYPSVVRDVSLAVSRSTQLTTVLDTLQAHGQDLCRSVSFVDLYEGKGLSDERSLTIRLEYRSDDRTLVEAEVDAAHDAILAALSEDLGIEPRK